MAAALGVNERRLFKRTFATEFGNPDFVALARAFGIAGFAVERQQDLEPTLRRAFDLDEPAVVAVPIDSLNSSRSEPSCCSMRTPYPAGPGLPLAPPSM